MMLKSGLVVSAIIATLANAIEEHSLEMEEAIVSGIDYFVPPDQKLYSYTSHLGQPAMHEEIEDGKHLNLLYHRSHQTLSNLISQQAAHQLNKSEIFSIDSITDDIL